MVNYLICIIAIIGVSVFYLKKNLKKIETKKEKINIIRKYALITVFFFFLTCGIYGILLTKIATDKFNNISKIEFLNEDGSKEIKKSKDLKIYKYNFYSINQFTKNGTTQEIIIYYKNGTKEKGYYKSPNFKHIIIIDNTLIDDFYYEYNYRFLGIDMSKIEIYGED